MKRIFWKFYDPGTGNGGGGETEEQKKQALLTEIQAKVKTEIETRGYQNQDAVQAIINETLKDIKLDALRGFDAASIATSVRNIAAEVEKVKNNQNGAGAEKRNLFKELFEKRMKDIESVYHARSGEVKLNIRAAAIMDTTNTIDETAINALDDLVESFSEAAFVPKRYAREYIFDIASRTTTAEIDKYTTWLEEGDIEGAFAIVEEGAIKPLVSMTLVRNVATAQKVAGKYVVTEEFTKFRKRAYAIMQTLFRDKLMRDYAGLLTADLITAAASYVGTSLDGTYDDPTDWHAIGAVAAQIESLNFMPDVLIMNPQDKWRAILPQNGSIIPYAFVPVTGPDGVTRILGLKVFTSNKLNPGEAIIGESGLFKIEDEAITVRVGYGNEGNTDGVSDFDLNQFRVIMETFFKDYIATNNTGSFVLFDIDAVKSALASA